MGGEETIIKTMIEMMEGVRVVLMGMTIGMRREERVE
jgi:hypothetical protein